MGLHSARQELMTNATTDTFHTLPQIYDGTLNMNSIHSHSFHIKDLRRQRGPGSTGAPGWKEQLVETKVCMWVVFLFTVLVGSVVAQTERG